MRTVVVTGACGGIGSATTAAFRAEGWRVIGIDARSPSDGAVDRFLQVDLEDLRGTEVLLRSLGDEPRLDALVNNAAISMDRKLSEISIAEWESTLAINVSAAFL